MRALALVLLVAGCASYDGRGLVPGQSSADKRPGAGGEVVTFFAQISPHGIPREKNIIDDPNRARR